MHARLFHNNALLKRWATSNLPLLCRPTTQQLLALSTTTFNQNAPKSHGHEIPLAPMPGSPRPIPILLASRTYQQSQLLDQAPLCSTPHWEAKWNPHAQKCTRVTLRFLEMHTSPSSSSHCINILTTHYIEVLKGCVRYPLSSYKGDTPLGRDASRSTCV